jgi:hypothetical protein
MLCSCCVTVISNLALNKPATLSSTLNYNDAERAVDGDTSGEFSDGSTCTHTELDSYEINPWWTVDLGGTYDVSKVLIYNRADCCGTLGFVDVDSDRAIVGQKALVCYSCIVLTFTTSKSTFIDSWSQTAIGYFKMHHTNYLRTVRFYSIYQHTILYTSYTG